MNFFVDRIEDLTSVAKYIVKQMEESRSFILKGEMGSGKTTLITELAKILKIEDEVSSPTYSIINEYLLPNGKKLFHFDLYRIKNVEELYDIGVEEYFDSDNFCFIEWPEIASELLPEKHIRISITTKNGGRVIKIEPTPAS